MSPLLASSPSFHSSGLLQDYLPRAEAFGNELLNHVYLFTQATPAVEISSRLPSPETSNSLVRNLNLCWTDESELLSCRWMATSVVAGLEPSSVTWEVVALLGSGLFTTKAVIGLKLGLLAIV